MQCWRTSPPAPPTPHFTLFVAADDNGHLLGSIDYIDDLTQYGVGSVATITDAAGVRLLAVDGACQGQGVGKALARFCIEHATAHGQSQDNSTYHQDHADGLGDV